MFSNLRVIASSYFPNLEFGHTHLAGALLCSICKEHDHSGPDATQSFDWGKGVTGVTEHPSSPDPALRSPSQAGRMICATEPVSSGR